MNKIGPNVEPCGIPDKKIWKTLSVPIIFTPCLIRFKYECTKVTATSDKPYESCFAASKSNSQKPWKDP